MKNTAELLQAVAAICKDNDEKRAGLADARNGGLAELSPTTLAKIFAQARSVTRTIEETLDSIWLMLLLHGGTYSIVEAACDSLKEAHKLQVEFCELVQMEIERRAV